MTEDFPLLCFPTAQIRGKSTSASKPRPLNPEAILHLGAMSSREVKEARRISTWVIWHFSWSGDGEIGNSTSHWPASLRPTATAFPSISLYRHYHQSCQSLPNVAKYHIAYGPLERTHCNQHLLSLSPRRFRLECQGWRWSRHGEHRVPALEVAFHAKPSNVCASTNSSMTRGNVNPHEARR